MPKVSKAGKFRQIAVAERASPKKSSLSTGRGILPSRDDVADAKQSFPRSDLVRTNPSSSSGTLVGHPGSPRESSTTNSTTTNTQIVPSLSRGQRKRQAKREQYLKRQELVLSSLRLQREKDQKKRIDGLDALKEALTQVSTEKVERTTTRTGKNAVTHNSSSKNLPRDVQPSRSRSDLTFRELEHMSLVLEHPSFKSNPLETIQLHLRNTLEASRKADSSNSQAPNEPETTRRIVRSTSMKKKKSKSFCASRKTNGKSKK